MKLEKYLIEKDEDNPLYAFQGLTNVILVMIANGKLDMKKIAKKELSMRGFDTKGNTLWKPGKSMEAGKRIKGF
jgi:hypothetical protein